MSSLLMQIAKEMLIVPSRSEQIDNLGKSLDRGFFSYDDLKSPELSKEFAHFMGLDIDFKKSLKSDNDDFIIKNYNLIKKLRWLFVVVFIMLCSSYYMTNTFGFSQLFPLFSMFVSFFMVSRSLVKMKNSYYQGKTRIFLADKKIEGKELHSYLSKFYIYQKTATTDNPDKTNSIENVSLTEKDPEEPIKRKRL